MYTNSNSPTKFVTHAIIKNQPTNQPNDILQFPMEINCENFFYLSYAYLKSFSNQ